MGAGVGEEGGGDVELLQLLLHIVPGGRERRERSLTALQSHCDRERRCLNVLLIQKDGQGVGAWLLQREGQLEGFQVRRDSAIFPAEKHRLFRLVTLDGELDVGLDCGGEVAGGEDGADGVGANCEGG